MQSEPAEVGAFVLSNYKIPQTKAPGPQGLRDEDVPTWSQAACHEENLAEAEDLYDEHPSSPPRKRPRQDMFSLVWDNMNEWELPDDQETFLGQYFAHWHNEDTNKRGNPQRQSCTKKQVPPLQLDEDIVDLSEGNAEAIVRENDRGLGRTGAKIIDAFGPLSKLWAILDRAKQDEEGEVNIKELATLMEKSMMLTHFYRQVQIMA